MKTRFFVLSTLILFFLSLWPRIAAARTWHIEPGGGGDAPTIQAGIDSAAAGDVVLLGPGTYTGLGNRDVDFRGKPVTVRSSQGAEATTIDCEGSGRAFVFATGEGPLSVLSGVRIVNGSHGLFGGAIYCLRTSPRIEDNIFSGNGAGYRGGAICCDSSLATIAGNVFESNQAAYGGAVSCFASASVEISSNEFRRNSAAISGGAVYARSSYPSIQQNRFVENAAANDGGAIYCDRESGATIASNTFRNNAAQCNGGAVGMLRSISTVEYNLFVGNQAGLGGAVYCDDFSAGPIEHNTFDGNGADSGAGVFCTNYSAPMIANNIVVNSTLGAPVETKNDSAPTIACCCFFGNAGGDALPLGCIDGGGNFALDPEFCGIEGSGNYYLQSDSPCAPGNTPGSKPCNLIGAFVVNCDITATERKTWGAIKALFGDE